MVIIAIVLHFSCASSCQSLKRCSLRDLAAIQSMGERPMSMSKGIRRLVAALQQRHAAHWM